MAFKTMKEDQFVSNTGYRLKTLMDESGFDTAPKLARELYEQGLIIPNSRSSYEEEYGPIKTITRRIQGHLNANGPEKISTNYAIAYSKIFHCSTDYILGLTDIRTNDMDTRLIAYKTGLSEKAVQNLLYGATRDLFGDDESVPEFTVTDENGSETTIPFNRYIYEAWSLLLESPLCKSIADDYRALRDTLMEYISRKAELEAREKVRNQQEYDPFMESLQDMAIDTLKEHTVPSYQTAYYGIIFKMASDITSFLSSKATTYTIFPQKEQDKIKEEKMDLFSTFFGQHPTFDDLDKK